MTTARTTQLRRSARTTPARVHARQKAAKETAAAAAKPARRPRRISRQRAPQRVQMSVRLLLEDDVRLDAALEQTGLYLQDGITEALRLWFKKLKIPVLPVPAMPAQD
ncbi:hypothetical protein [Streptomyces rubiginosohelvolus]|uniref:Uncharacterized protein n=1 Tax=Streptomyces rubiginosohelvolus TaxID=67362 RepID=A0ABQ3CCT9_9ACTN|nr:hypothetical protein [Streptomyces pluricolorescens]GGZ84008.1 hypothetical protein GCM10010328_67640 [Streptomyces pluricolorescens]